MDLQAVVDGKTNEYVDIFVYLYRAVCEVGGSRFRRKDVASRSGSVEGDGGYFVGHSTSVCIWLGNPCTDRETGGEATCNREQLGSGNVSSETRRHQMLRTGDVQITNGERLTKRANLRGW